MEERKLTSMFPHVVNAVKIKRNPKPRTTTLKVLLSAMVPLSDSFYIKCCSQKDLHRLHWVAELKEIEPVRIYYKLINPFKKNGRANKVAVRVVGSTS